ncbi:ribosome small subunit-dependent GTPase A [bacterium]|nr:ribosome small subunit-dependent GTPase A [bacterium]
MLGRVIKIFSDFYYVETEIGIVESKLRSILKKQKKDVFVGDIVELEQLDKNSMQAFLLDVKKRLSIISRPKVANITQVIIVSALKEPELNFEQLDRFIAHCVYHNIPPVLCFNKEDIIDSELLKDKVINMYSHTGYKIVFTSALQKTGIEEIKPLLKNNITMLCGSSGVGKSSLINAILNNANLKVGHLSEKTQKGVHTTRHCELLLVDKNSFIVDTPGFSQLKFDFLLPSEIKNLFVEFKKVDASCKYKNCLHSGEDGCSYSKIISQMPESRYSNYLKFVSEAKLYEQKISKVSIKKESNVKHNQNKVMTKISNKKRNKSRKTFKQNILKEEI